MAPHWRERVGSDLPGSVRRAAIAAGLPHQFDDSIVTAAAVEPLPATVQRYLRFMQVVGRRRDQSFVSSFVGRFRQRPNQRWMPFRAWQYSASDPVTRIFHMRLSTPYLVPLVAEDSYLAGRGEMHGSLGGIITVARGTGPSFDAGELVTYLNDAILVAPGLLLGQAQWSSRSADAFDVALTDRGLTVTATVVVDRRGAPLEFATLDRSTALAGGPVRARWSTPVGGWTETDGRPLPNGASAIWDLPDGPFTYAQGRFEPSSMRFDVDPVRWAAVEPAGSDSVSAR